MTFNSDEVNLLVYRYLEESGYRHSAWAFGYESNVLNAGIDSTAIPRGALASLLQKGCLFAEAEVFSLTIDNNEIDSRFEKAIGCMTILECAMCDSTRIKALQRRTAIQHRPNVVDEQQKSSNWTEASFSQAYQNHGLNSSRSELVSSVKPHSFSTPIQQVQKDREFRPQQQANQTANSVVCIPPPKASYRTQDRQNEHVGMKCNPTMAGTSTTSSVASSHPLYPNTSVMGLQHPFYQQSFGKTTSTGIGHQEMNYLSANASNGTNPLNGPSSQTQIASSTGAFQNLSTLHHQNLNSSPDPRMLINGTASYISTGGGTSKRGVGNT